MIWYVSGGIAVGCLALLLFLLRPRSVSLSRLPYVRKREMFSASQQNLIDILDRLLGQHYLVLAKVRVADLVSIRAGIGRSAWKKAFRQLNWKTFDIVVCAREDYEVVCVIQVDGAFHRNRRRKERFLSAVCRAAGLPLIRVPDKKAYDTLEIQTLIHPVVRSRELETLDSGSLFPQEAQGT